jgi:hypothetical protein
MDLWNYDRNFELWNVSSYLLGCMAEMHCFVIGGNLVRIKLPDVNCFLYTNELTHAVWLSYLHAVRRMVHRLWQTWMSHCRPTVFAVRRYCCWEPIDDHYFNQSLYITIKFSPNVFVFGQCHSVFSATVFNRHRDHRSHSTIANIDFYLI